MPPRPTSLTPAQAQREAIHAFALACVLLILAALLSLALPFVRANLGFIAAVIFIFLPGYFLKRHGERDADYGLSFHDWKRGTVWALGTTLITLVFFIPAFHLYNSHIEGRALHVDSGNYLRVGERFLGQPVSVDDGRVHVWTWGTQLVVDWRPDEGPYQLVLRQSSPAEGTGFATTPTQFSAGTFQHELRLEGQHAQPQRLVLQPVGVRELHLQVSTGPTDNPRAVPIVTGAGSKALPDGQEGRIPLGFGWLLSVILTQLILVAVPEEFFFRGFIQTRLTQAWGSEGWTLFGLPLHRAILVSSALFAFSHLFVGFGLHRLLVFFPSLLFGALREKTGGLVASILYHAACNLMVILVSVHYF